MAAPQLAATMPRAMADDAPDEHSEFESSPGWEALALHDSASGWLREATPATGLPIFKSAIAAAGRGVVYGQPCCLLLEIQQRLGKEVLSPAAQPSTIYYGWPQENASIVF